MGPEARRCEHRWEPDPEARKGALVMCGKCGKVDREESIQAKAGPSRETTQLDELIAQLRERWEAQGVFERNEHALALEREQQQAEERERMLADMADRGLPREHREQLLAGLDGTDCALVAEQWLGARQATLVLAGGVGCGKTQAAAWCVQHRGRFVDVARLARMSRYDEREMAPLELTPVLAIDDLGTEYLDPRGFYQSLLDGLVNARCSEGRKTVITTNLASDAFRARYGPRLWDRVRTGRAGRYYESQGASLRRRDT